MSTFRHSALLWACAAAAGPACADTLVTAAQAPLSVCAPAPTGGQQRIVDRAELTEWLSLSNDLRIRITPVDASHPDGPRFDPVQVFGDPETKKQYKANVRFPELPAADAAKKIAALDGTFDGLLQSIHIIGRPDNPATMPFHGTADFEEQGWLTQPSWAGPMQIICNTPAPASGASANADSVFSVERIRVRGTPDTLTSDRSSDSFQTADAATVSFSYNGQTNTRTDILQAAVGYDILPNTDPNKAIVLYAATNRNITTVSGSPSANNIEYADLGLAFGYTWIGNEAGNVLSGTPHYLLNLIDDSRLFGLHVVDQPILTGHDFRLNWFYFVGANGDPNSADHWLEIAPLFDLRADADFYTDRGSAPLTNQDYFRAGSRFGGQVNLPKFFHSSITVADTWMYGFTGSQQQLNDFQASWTVNLDPEQKYFGLSFSYKIGRIEATGQKEQIWLISLTGKY
jgi:hypothetical protein